MIALIDCNNFYCSCERVFDPLLLGKAMIVLSNNDGCAIARSEEAKAIGIKMGTPAFMIREKLEKNKVQVQSSNYVLYGDMSNRVMQVIREFVPKTEIYSIDEIFADLSQLKFANLFELGREIREQVMRCTGIPVSIGIAATKTLAKMANRYAKKTGIEEGVYLAGDARLVEQMMSYTSVADIWGIGKEYAELLVKHGFTTAADLARAPEEWVRKNMSVVGQRILHEINGKPCIKWEEQPSAKKNICTSRSFGQLTGSKNDMRQAVAKFTSSCAEKLRREGSCARKLQVFIQTNPHRNQDPQYFQSITLELAVPSNSTSQLMRYSMSGLDMIFQPGYNYQKAGVMVLDLVPATQVQLGLFETQNWAKEKELMATLDEVNKYFGRDMVRFGVQAYGTAWNLRQENLSPKYTTRLDQIPKAG